MVNISARLTHQCTCECTEMLRCNLVAKGWCVRVLVYFVATMKADIL